MADFAADDFALAQHDWFTGTATLAEVAHLLEDRAAAAILRERLQPFAGRITIQGPGVGLPVDQALAQLALTLDDPEAAETAASRAVDASRRRATLIYLGQELDPARRRPWPEPTVPT